MHFEHGSVDFPEKKARKIARSAPIKSIKYTFAPF
jgi:hypothetical protein